MASAFGMNRKSHDGSGRTRNMIIRLLKRRRDSLISGTLRTGPFSEEMMEVVYETRKRELIAGN